MKKYLIISFLFLSCSPEPKEPNPDKDTEPVPKNEIPTTPVLLTPSNESLCVDNLLEFSWEHSQDPDNDPINYEIQIATDQYFGDVLYSAEVKETFKQFSLEKGKLMFWRVRAKDSENGLSNFSSPWSFYTEGESELNRIPFPASNLFPNMNATIGGNSVVLEWNATDLDGDELEYDLYFGIETPPELFQNNLKETNFKVNLSTQTTYYWRIMVKDPKGGSSLGQIWSFLTY